MRIQTIMALGAIFIGLGMSPVVAQGASQNGPHIGSWPTPAEQQELTREPGFSLGTGAAHVGNGSNLGYVNEQKQLTTAPGYSVGTGSVQTTKK
jgi:hypothetical protein